MAKQEEVKVLSFKEKAEETLIKLKEQRDDTKTLWTKCQGAIEVLESLISEA
tara:strand:+ start:6416 stop:6571 length:156 start_codon:yes stop_codon:yes gene_type:complete